MKRLQIFRTGKQTAMNGVTYEFTEQMLRDAVAAYDTSVHEAPIVVGHPKLDDPAYGWVNRLSFSEGGIVEAEPHEVDAAFAELVDAKRYKKISASWYLPDAPSNPKPGVLYLRHVGFLGAQPPAIKGLKNAEFAANEEGVIEFGDWADSQTASMFRRMREWLIEKFSREDADKVIPEWEIKSLEEAARSPERVPAYSERSTDPEQSTMTTEALKQKEADIAKREAALKRAEHVAFCDGLIKDGKLLPTHKDGVVAFMSSIDVAGTVEFGEGDKAVKQGATEWFRTFLSQLPKAVEFRERAPGSVADEKVVSFSAPAGYSVDTSKLDLHTKACAHMIEHKVDYVTAVKAIEAAG